jgi:1-acyl-sn-glycerol-3-phosphate acyltransferase
MQIDAANNQNDPRDQMKFTFHRTFLRKIIVGTLRLIIPLFARIEVTGLNNIPESGPIVLASNHLTNFDPFALQKVIRRPLFFMAKSELHINPIMDTLLRNLGTFPVHRGKRDQWAIDHAKKVLQHDQILAIFPEGTRSKIRGLKPGKTGAARLAIQQDCQIIPVAINGSPKIFKSFPRRAEIHLLIGNPIEIIPGESTLGLTDRLMFTLAELLPVELRGVYTKKPQGFDFIDES